MSLAILEDRSLQAWRPGDLEVGKLKPQSSTPDAQEGLADFSSGGFLLGILRAISCNWSPHCFPWFLGKGEEGLEEVGV